MAFGQIPTQLMAGPVATGQAYAQQIAGGMPMEQVIAPGVSYSPEQAGGYTQKDLDMIAAGPAPVMPKAPTTGVSFAPNEGFVQMPSAPQGVAQPTRFMPFLQDLDFSGLPRYEDIRDISGPQDIRPTLFDIDIEEILKDIDTEKFEDIDLTNMDMPSIAPTMPQVPVQAPMNFTGLPQMPIMPQVPVMPQPIQPMNFTRLSNLPVSNFVQPSVEEIISPIRIGRTLPQTPRGLFSL